MSTLYLDRDHHYHGDMVAVRVRAPKPTDGAEIGRVHVRAWKAAYAGLMPPLFLDALDEDERGRAWERRLRARQIDLGLSRPENELLVADVAVRSPERALTDHGERRVVGVATIGPERDSDVDGRGEVWMINIIPDAWRQGVGTTLFGAATDRLAELGFETNVLWVVDGNDRARRFYERMGWTSDGTAKLESFGDALVREVRYVR